MGRPTGFIDFARRSAPGRPPLERIHDWSEEHPHLDDGELRDQASRCMDCGVPFCHTGVLIGGMASGCPINNLVPEWNDLVHRGQWQEASIRLHRTNNFPEFTGRVCPAPCEGSCTVGLNGDPVTIKTIEQEIADRAWAEGWVTPSPPLTRTGRTVAVVGSGPAGLAAADQLNRAGHLVTVYERAGRIGGLLMYGIPNMKLDKDVVSRRTGLMADEGVRFETGVTIGADIAVDRLLAEHDAVVLATGSTLARDLGVPGRELGGIHLAMSFLRGNTRRLLDGGAEAEAPIDASGRDVIVIGGGDTGTDCVGTAIRQGARSVRQLEIMPRPPETRAADNPWPEWPKVYRLDYGQEEAKALFHHDAPVHRPQRARDRDRDRGHLVGSGGGWAARDARGARHVPGAPRGPRAAGAGLHGPRERAAEGVRVRPRSARERADGPGPDDDGAGRVRGGGLRARPVAGRLGDPRGPDGGPGRGPLPDARRDGAAGLIRSGVAAADQPEVRHGLAHGNRRRPARSDGDARRGASRRCPAKSDGDARRGASRRCPARSVPFPADDTHAGAIRRLRPE
jgi:glutamate synthase (NADPH/NADH) small chain